MTPLCVDRVQGLSLCSGADVLTNGVNSGSLTLAKCQESARQLGMRYVSYQGRAMHCVPMPDSLWAVPGNRYPAAGYKLYELI